MCGGSLPSIAGEAVSKISAQPRVDCPLVTAGLHMEIRDGPEGPDGPIQLISYCPKHCTPQPQLSGEEGCAAPRSSPALLAAQHGQGQQCHEQPEGAAAAP